ncbi:MAG: GtrA family protein [Ruegeria sp.]
MRHQIFRFSFVGGLATLLHMAVGSTLIHAGWRPLLANVVSFVIAFLVSFMGHYGFSFPDHSVPIAASLRRFIVVAGTGFLINETILAGLLEFSSFPAIFGLIISTIAAAVFTFFASRNWAFRNSGDLLATEEISGSGEVQGIGNV